MTVEQPVISIKKIQGLQLGFIALFSATALFVYSVAVAQAVLVGGLLSFVSFLWLHRDITKIFSGPLQATKILFFIKYYARLALLAVVLYMIVKNRLFNVIGLLAGMSTVVLGIVITALGEVRKMHVNVKEAA